MHYRGFSHVAPLAHALSENREVEMDSELRSSGNLWLTGGFFQFFQRAFVIFEFLAGLGQLTFSS